MTEQLLDNIAHNFNKLSFKKTADKGNIDRIFMLSYYNEYRIDVEKDKAFAHYQKSVELNNLTEYFKLTFVIIIELELK